MKKMVLAIVAMACITTLEMTALVLGIDGTALAGAVAAVAALGGYAVGQSKSS